MALRSRLVFGDPEPVDEELMGELRLRYRGEVEAAGAYLQRDLLKMWGYDRLS